MAVIGFYMVDELPAQLEPRSFYFVLNGTIAEAYLTNGNSVAKGIGNSDVIESVVAPLIQAALAQSERMKVVADIAARDALADPGYNMLVLVVDASADATVDAGAATYVFNTATNQYVKIAEHESQDFSLAWNAITGRPASTPAAIDAAVAASHAHANMAVLNKLTEAGGALLFDGDPIQAAWGATDW